MVWILWIVWEVTQNNYFGWFTFPGSHAELAADAFSIYLLAMAVKSRNRA
jgi:hypothetical protein